MKYTKPFILPDTFNKPAFSGAIRKLFESASDSLGFDCYSHHAIASAALTMLGVPNELCIGYAAWRVNGEAPHGVVAHHTVNSFTFKSDSTAILYHSWLKVGPEIVDFTTYQLPMKAAELDAIDGKHTIIEWAPDYLWSLAKNGVSYTAVREGYIAGLFHYRRDMGLERHLKSKASPVNHEDVEYLLIIYHTLCQGDSIHVFGPNNLTSCRLHIPVII